MPEQKSTLRNCHEIKSILDIQYNISVSDVSPIGHDREKGDINSSVFIAVSLFTDVRKLNDHRL